MVDTGAQHSVITKPIAPLSRREVTVVGATGGRANRPFLKERLCELGGHQVKHQFLYMPDCPIPLLGRDLLSKLQAQITFTPSGEANLTLPKTPATGLLALHVPREEEWRLFTVAERMLGIPPELSDVPGVWAEDNPPGLARNIAPVIVELKPGAQPVSLRQYFIPRKAVAGIQTHLNRLLKYGILKPCQSPWNTPLLPVQKPGTDDYRPVQDLRAVNQATVTIHPVVPNPYVLLGLVPAEATHFTVLDLKDAFFCLRLAAQSQSLFAFQWEDAATGVKGQLTWTRLPQGFKNSPTLFGTALSQDLKSFESEPGKRVLLQYVDDLLVGATSRQECIEATQELLHLLWTAGYKVSRKKAQICQDTVKYLGFHISKGQRHLGQERKEAVCSIPTPKSRKQVREFLGAAGFCRIWIPNFALMAKPLYQATKGGEREPFEWGPEQDKAFVKIKAALISAPSLGLPDAEKPFSLYVHERKGTAVGVLTQTLGSWQRPVAYLSKQLDPVAQGWPPCLRSIAATVLLVTEADKLTLGQELYVHVPHAVITLMDYKGNHWFTNSRMVKYQGMLCENPRVHLDVVKTLNPATLLPVEPGPPEHDCLQVMDEVFSSRPDLKDTPLVQPDAEYFTDGSSYVKDGFRYAGYAVVTVKTTIEARPLPQGTSAQKAELIALTRALQLAAGIRVNIYTDSKYAFTTLHCHGALYKEKGLIDSSGKAIKYGKEILELLDAVWAPKAVAVMHCRAHQKGDSLIVKGNRRADQEARKAAVEKYMPALVTAAPLFPVPLSEWEPRYSKAENLWLASEPGVFLPSGWFQLADQRLVIPDALAPDFVKEFHEGTHLGKTATEKALGKYFYVPKLATLAQSVSLRCLTCARNNPRQGPLNPPQVQSVGGAPMENIMVDFTEMPRVRGCKYLLVLVCTYSGWVEAFPVRTERAREVSRILLKEIIPRYGMPLTISSDNGPGFVAECIQEVATSLKITWKLHSAYRPQSSGKVERMNRTIKLQLSKLCQETQLKWDQLLPIVLLRIRCSPTKATGLSPFEILYGRPPPIIQGLRGDLRQIGGEITRQQLQALGSVFSSLNRWVQERLPISLSTPIHQFEPGDQVWVKEWNRVRLGPRWRGPYTVLLATPTAVKVAEITPWIHHSRLKRAAASWEATTDPVNPCKITIRRQTLGPHPPGAVGRHGQRDDRPALITPEADQSTHG